MDFTTKRIVSYVLIAVLVILALTTLLSSFGTVGPGERGVKLRFNAVTGVIFDEGLYFKWPFIESVEMMSVQINKSETIATSGSKDMQSVKAVMAVTYKLDPTKVDKIYQEFKRDIQSITIDSAIQESVKSTTAQYTSEELLSKRAEVSDKIAQTIKNKLSSYGVLIELVNVVDFSFSPEYDAEIEKRQVAEMQIGTANNQLETVKIEALKKVEEARGNASSTIMAAEAEAKAVDILSKALAKEPRYIEYKKIEKWNGAEPQVVGQAAPILNLGAPIK